MILTDLKYRSSIKNLCILHGYKLSILNVYSYVWLALEWYTHMLWLTLNEPQMFDV